VTTQHKAPPGWYPDPYRHAEQRWYDGREWTRHVHPVGPIREVVPPGSLPTGMHPIGAEYWLIPVGRSWQAVVAPWVGLGGLFIPFLGIAAIVLAVLALRLPKDPHHPGRGRPIVAIVLGVIGTAYWAAVLGAALLSG
jgi:Protein of unknown function (DUF2510)